MSETVKVGIVGIGNMGSAHAKSIFSGNIKGMELAAVCDIAESKRLWADENLPGVPCYEDYKEMIDSGVCDTVIVATPHYFHSPIAIYAFEKGKNVLTEKPAGVYTKQVEEMNAAAKKSGKVFGIMYNQRTNPKFQKMREIVQSGELGELKRCIWIITNWYRTQAYYDSGTWRATWAGEGGGVLLNQCPHQLDLWQWIFGMPNRVMGHCKYGHWHNIEVEDEVTAYAEYPNGATGAFITTTGECPGTNRLEITGDKGKLVWEEGKLTWWKLAVPEREFCVTCKEGFAQPEMTVTAISKLLLLSPIEDSPSLSNRTGTGGVKAFRVRKLFKISTVFLPKRFMPFVKIRSILPAFASSIMSLNPCRLFVEVPLTP